MIRLYVEGVGLCGPGLPSWAAARPVLAGAEAYVPAPTKLVAPALLPPNERRRAVQSVKIALAAGAEALAASGLDAAGLPTVFASSGGDGETIHDILGVLAGPEPALSPTRFHNSVHNTAAGYWSLAAGATAASTSLCCHDDSFAAGLLEVAAQVAAAGGAALLIAYDAPYPPPLHEVRPIGAAFGVAVALAAEPGPAALASLALALRPGTATPTASNGELENLRRAVPAARSLPLLAALALGGAAEVTLDYLGDSSLTLHLAPLP